MDYELLSGLSVYYDNNSNVVFQETIEIGLYTDIVEFVQLVDRGFEFDRMVVLDLCSQKLNAKDIQPLAGLLKLGKCPKKMVLLLWWNDFGAEGIRLFAEALQSKNCPEQLTLDLSYNEIGMEGFRYLAEVLQSGYCPKDLTIKVNKITINLDIARIFACAMIKAQMPYGFNLQVDNYEMIINCLNVSAQSALKKIEAMVCFESKVKEPLQQLQNVFFAATSLYRKYVQDTKKMDELWNSTAFVFIGYEKCIRLLLPETKFEGECLKKYTGAGNKVICNVYNCIDFTDHFFELNEENQEEVYELKCQYFGLCNILIHKEKAICENSFKTQVSEKYHLNYEFDEGPSGHNQTLIGIKHSHSAKIAFKKIKANLNLLESDSAGNRGDVVNQDHGWDDIISTLQTVEFYCISVLEKLKEIKRGQNWLLYRAGLVLPWLLASYKVVGEFILAESKRLDLMPEKKLSHKKLDSLIYLLQKSRHFFEKYGRLLIERSYREYFEFIYQSYHCLIDQLSVEQVQETRNNTIEADVIEAREYHYRAAIWEKIRKLVATAQYDNLKNYKINEMNTVREAYGLAQKHDVLVRWGHVELYLRSKRVKLEEYRRTFNFFQTIDVNKKYPQDDLFVKRDDNSVDNDSLKTYTKQLNAPS